MAFYNGSTHIYHFIMKNLVKEFNAQFEHLGKNTAKYITFLVTIRKELDNGETITYRLKFIDSFRFMFIKLSNLINDSGKCIDFESHLDNMSIKHDQLIFNYFECKRIIKQILIKI